MSAFINATTGKPDKRPIMKMESTTHGGSRPLSFEAACKRFKQRFTLDHIPGWARHIAERTGKYPAPRYHSDEEWYKRSEFIGFATTASRKYVRENDPTYPVGRWLDKPFKREEFGKIAKTERKAERYATTREQRKPQPVKALSEMVAKAVAKAPARKPAKVSGKKANHRPSKAGKKPTNGNGKKK